MKKLLLFLVTGFSWLSFSQTTVVIMDAGSNNTTVNTCLGGLFDSGGAGASTPYSNNENYTVTICPDTPGDFITLYWVVFQLDPTDNIPGSGSDADHMTIYDGPNTSAGTLGTYTANDLDGLIVSASILNPSGCLTIVFQSNATGVGNFNASISCDTPCDPPIVAGQIVNADNVTGDSIAVCIGELVNFQDTGTVPGDPLFTLVQWTWDFMDGSMDSTSGTSVSHAFDTPGEYLVQLYVEDDNGCTNNNLLSLQVLVATLPTFDPFPGDTTICLGESVTLAAQPQDYEVEWTGFPGGVWDEEHCVGDEVGVLNTLPMTMTGFNSSEVIDQVSDIISICVDIEHSFMGDFVLQIQCPTGQIMTLHQQGGGGTNLGIPSYTGPSYDNVNEVCLPANFGTPWTYCFTPGATTTWIAATPVAGTLPAGNYAPIDPFTDLFGCPLNGVWNLLFTDLWGGDDGYIPGFSINLDPPLYPAITQFTPHIGLGADSSYWDLSDPYIIASTPNANEITVQPAIDGVFTYTYYAVNDFGCAYDTTVNVTVTPNPPAIAGLDTSICNGQTVTLGEPVPLCNNSSGNFTYCYGNNVYQTWTYCPDTPGDGLTFMTISFNAGSTETGFDYVTIYNGSTTGASVIAGPLDGNLAGLSWQATNPSGCITMLLTSDGSVSCTSGSTTPWNWDVTCGGGPALVYSWTPNNGSLDDVTIPTPTVINATASTTYTLTVYPVGHPLCTTTDDVTVLIGGGLDAGTDSVATFCFEGAPEDLFNYLGGTPQTGGVWYDPAGNIIAMPITPATAAPGQYMYRVDSAGCFVTAYVDVTIFTLQASSLATNSDCQACNGSVELSSTNGVTPLQFSNDGGTTFQAGNIFGSLCGSASPGVNYDFVVMDAQGCLADVSDVVEDINIPTLNTPTVANASCYTVCDGEITLTGTNLTNYQITSSGGTVTNNTTGAFTGLCADTYDIYVDNGFGCSLTATATITEPTPLQITSLTPDFSICAGDLATVSAAGSGGNGVYTFTWTANGASMGTGSSVDLNPNTSVNVCVTLSENCPSPTVQQCMNITVPPDAYPLMTSDITGGCYPDTVTFTNLTTYPGIGTTTWSFSDGGSIVANGTDPVTYVFNSPGLYDVTMTITTLEGCIFDTTFVEYIEEFDFPSAMFTYGPIPATIFDTEITFNDYSSDDVVQWFWSLGASAIPGASSEQDPTAVYPEGIANDYPVVLYVWNANGCVDSVAGVVSIVNDVTLFAPNIFTPDGDEYNESWRVYIAGIDIYDFHLTMFNRWGEIVWESYNPDATWNGRYGSQGMVQDGTYVWVIEAKDSYNDKKYEFRGHVTVLK